MLTVGLVVLIGWATGIEILKTGGPGLVTMKPNTAVCFVLLDAATWALRRHTRRRHVLRRVASLIAASIGVRTLIEYLTGGDLLLDQLLFSEHANAVATAAPGRMAPTTAFCFVLLGMALAIRGSSRMTRVRRTDVLVAGATLIAFLAFVGYLYGASPLVGLGSSTQMAIHTSLTFMVLCLSMVAISPRRSVTAILLRASPGGAVARRLIPPTIAVPVAVGWIRLLGERAGLYDTPFGLSIMVGHWKLFALTAKGN